MTDLPKETADAMIAQEELVAKILKVRSGGKSKSFWEMAGVIPAATAILTVLVTSIVGYETQKALKDRENNFVTTHENRLVGREVAKRANSALAGMLKINDERLKMAQGGFDDLSKDQRHEITQGSNHIQQDWRQQREDVEIELYLVFDSSSMVAPAWQHARETVELQTSCIEAVYASAQQTRIKGPVCDSQIASSKAAVNDLRRKLKNGYEHLAKF
jgi:hypothetical protein